MENFLTDAITNSSHMRQMIAYLETVFKYKFEKFYYIFGIGIINGFKSSLPRTWHRTGLETLKLASNHTFFGGRTLCELVAEPLQRNVTKHWRGNGHE